MKFGSELIKNIVPYTAGEQPLDKCYIKLNTNENPYPPSPEVYRALSDIDAARLAKYPDPNCTKLKRAIASVNNLLTDNIFVSNGSDELLAFCFKAFFNVGDIVSFADITYSFYPVYADFFGINKDIIPLTAEFRTDISKYLNRKSNGILIANPNAPTSIADKLSDIEKIIQNNLDKVVIIDEAYADFCDESAVSLVSKYDNLLIVRTFSKSYSLAGARCGYAIGNADLIACLCRVKDSFNSYTVSYITQSIAEAAYLDRSYFDSKVAAILSTRERLITRLRSLGFQTLQSSTNFLFIKLNNAEDVYLKLKAEGVLVRHFPKDKIKNYIRVTVGTDLESDIFLEKLQLVTKVLTE